MNKKLINSKIADLETELQKLKELANEPWPEPRRTPEAGDVWIAARGKTVVVDDKCGYTYTEDGYRVASISGNEDVLKTYLGKFSEVYVKISDVREALSHRDSRGDNTMMWLTSGGCAWGCSTTCEAFRELGIIIK